MASGGGGGWKGFRTIFSSRTWRTRRLTSTMCRAASQVVPNNKYQQTMVLVSPCNRAFSGSK